MLFVGGSNAQECKILLLRCKSFISPLYNLHNQTSVPVVAVLVAAAPRGFSMKPEVPPAAEVVAVAAAAAKGAVPTVSQKSAGKRHVTPGRTSDTAHSLLGPKSLRGEFPGVMYTPTTTI